MGTELELLLFSAFFRNAEFVLHTNRYTHSSTEGHGHNTKTHHPSKHHGQQRFLIDDETLDEIILPESVKCTYTLNQ